MSVQTEIDRLASAKAAIKTAIEGKGVAVPDATLLDGMAALIEGIETGRDGIRAVMGEITPIEAANYIEVEHGLGVVPNFAFLGRFESKFPANTYAACYKKDDEGVSILRTGSNSNQIMCLTSTYPITGIAPTSTMMTAAGVGAYAATEKTIRFGNENLTSVTVNISTATYIWIVWRSDE